MQNIKAVLLKCPLFRRTTILYTIFLLHFPRKPHALVSDGITRKLYSRVTEVKERKLEYLSQQGVAICHL